MVVDAGDREIEYGSQGSLRQQAATVSTASSPQAKALKSDGADRL